MQTPRTPAWVVWVVPALLASTSGLGLSLYYATRTGLPEPEKLMLDRVHQQILRVHVDPQDPHELMLRAIHGMVSGLDPYSEFVRPDQAKEFDRQTSGVYEGIGVLMVPGVLPITVLYPLLGGPAEKAGIRVGDQILAVDGVALEGSEPDRVTEQARDMLLGAPDTRVTITVRRGDGAPFDVALVRGPVQQSSVRWTRFVDAERGIGYLHIGSFQNQTYRELDAALGELAGQQTLRALILDLRFNGGGLLEQALPVVNHFLPEGVITTLVERDRPRLEHRTKPGECKLPDLPLVLLVDRHSASASEIVASALQDHGRARVVGERTYGKAMVQSILRWPDLPMRLKLTTGRYLTPDGRDLNGPRKADGKQTGGVVPHVESLLEPLVAAAVHARLASPQAVPAAYRAEAEALARRLEHPLPEPVGPERDQQLARAIDEARRLMDLERGR